MWRFSSLSRGNVVWFYNPMKLAEHNSDQGIKFNYLPITVSLPSELFNKLRCGAHYVDYRAKRIVNRGVEHIS